MVHAPTIRWWTIVTAAVLAVGASVAFGPSSSQSSAAAGPTAPVAKGVHKLELASVPEIPFGKAAIVGGIAGPSAQKLAVGDLSVLQPVRVLLIAPDTDDDVRIELSKFILDRPARSGTTKGDGYVSFQFRTQGDLQIALTSPAGPTPYRLLVWAGEEATPTLPSAFVSMKAFQAQQPQARGAGGAGSAATGASMPLWIGAGALVVIAALLAMVVLKRGKS